MESGPSIATQADANAGLHLLRAIDIQTEREIIVSEKDRIAGTINIKDRNLSITGAFDCPSRYR